MQSRLDRNHLALCFFVSNSLDLATSLKDFRFLDVRCVKLGLHCLKLTTDCHYHATYENAICINIP